MGGWFSSPRQMLLDWMAQRMIPRVLPPFDLPPFDARHPCIPEELYNFHICHLALYALKHYNSKHPDAKFWFPDHPKAAWTGFREDIWYHLNFSARSKEDGDEQRFFAELSFVQCPCRLIIKSCTILKKSLCRFKTSCALCPDESKILHPSHIQLGCGKKEHEEELYRERHQWDWDPRRKDYFRREMLETPFRLGGDRCPFSVEKRAMKRNSSVRDVSISGIGECRLNC